MLYNETKESVVAENIEFADSFTKRFFGLMGRKGLKESSCMMFIGCSSIHMFFMRFAIDVVFLDRDNRVIYMQKDLQPWKVVWHVKNAYITIELQQGTVDKCAVSNGDILIVK